MRKFLKLSVFSCWLLVSSLSLLGSLGYSYEWVSRYNGPGNIHDYANAIAVDGSGNVYVTGGSYGSGTDCDYATIKYNSSGVAQWVARYNGPGNYRDWASAIAVDGSGNVYVTGYSYDPGTNYDYATIKYNSSGVEQWVSRYNGPSNSTDFASAIAVDGEYVYVTGGSYGSGTDCDYATIKYNSSGVAQWVARYNGPGYDPDYANAIAVDGSGNVYVTGYSYDPGTDYDYATIKYNSSGVEQWVARYNGPGNYYDRASAIAVDGNYVYVTGESRGSGTYEDYATIKYSAVGVEERNERLEIGDWRLEVYPDPCFGNAVIKYQVPEITNVSLRLYDISGRLVRTIYSGVQEKGYYETRLTTDRRGLPLPVGIYFIRLEVSTGLRTTQKLTIIR